MSVYKQSIQTKTAFLGGKIKGNFFAKNRETQDPCSATSWFYAVLFISFYLCTVELWVVFPLILNFSVPFKLFLPSSKELTVFNHQNKQILNEAENQQNLKLSTRQVILSEIVINKITF